MRELRLCVRDLRGRAKSTTCFDFFFGEGRATTNAAAPPPQAWDLVKKLQDEVAALKSQKSSTLDAIIAWASDSKGSSNAIPVVVAVADVFVATVAEGASEDDVSAQ